MCCHVFSKYKKNLIDLSAESKVLKVALTCPANNFGKCHLNEKSPCGNMSDTYGYIMETSTSKSCSKSPETCFHARML